MERQIAGFGGSYLAAPASENQIYSQEESCIEDRESHCTILQLDHLIPMTAQDQGLESASQLFQKLQQQWPQTSMAWTFDFLEELPDLQPEIKHVVRQLPLWRCRCDPVVAVHIYVDGSSFENCNVLQNSLAAWAFIVMTEHVTNDSASHSFYAATSHCLSSARSANHQFRGVGELTSDPASTESVAMIMAMTWIAQSPFDCPHTIHYDSCTVGHFAAGESQWNAGWEHDILKQNITAMRHCFQAIGWDVRFAHVKAHEGHPINETVDALAKATAKKVVPSFELPCHLSTVLLNRYMPFAWISLTNAAAVPTPFGLRGTFLAEGPFPGQEVDTTWRHPQPSEQQTEVSVKLIVATANVLTLDPGSKSGQLQGLLQMGRIATLQAQFNQAKVHFIGLQECRTQKPLTRHSGTHLVFQSGATETGSRGCELWVDRSQPYAEDQHNKFCFAQDHFHIASYDDRHLLAIVRAPHLHLRLLVIHAPHQGFPEEICQQWWSDIQILITNKCSHLPLIVLGDMNAKLGSNTSDAVGSHCPETENRTGRMLHAFMLEADMWAPSTFSHIHQGTSSTWTSSDGDAHRIDFVLLPSRWKAFEIRSFVQLDVDLCIAKQDHDVAAVEIRMQAMPSKAHRLKQHRIDTRLCADPIARQGFLEYISDPPLIPWTLGVGEHAEVLTEWIQCGAEKFFKPAKPLPRQRYMSQNTWNLVQLRKQLRQLAYQAESHAQLITVKMCFVHWRSSKAVGSSSLVSTFSLRHDEDFSILKSLRTMCLRHLAWNLHMRQQLHSMARHASKQDRIDCAQSTVDAFFKAAQGHNSRELFRALKPLLGQSHRQASRQFRPLPAVRLKDDSLAPDHDTASKRWQEHFADPEQGIPVTVDQLQLLAKLQAPRFLREDLSFDLNSVPNLEAIESYIHKSRAGKCPGIDGIPSEIFKIHPALMSQIFWPLLAKCALRCTEPLRWRGGEIIPLAKTPHPGPNPEQYRSIILADFASKLCHGLLRSRLLPSIESYRLNMQAGGIPGLGTDAMQLFVQSFVKVAHQRHQSCGLLFVDIRQAFYKACRPLLLYRHVSNETLAVLFKSNGWSPDFLHSFHQRLAEPPALEQARVSKHHQAQIASMLSATWFQVKGQPSTLTSTASGTRPGDSIADLLYAFLMTRFLECLRQEFMQAKLHTQLPVKWIPAGVLQPGDMPAQDLIQASWVDDLVLLLKQDDPLQLVAQTRQAISITQDVAASFALQLNFSRDKTSVLLSLKGPKSRQVWSHILAADPINPVIQFECASLPSPGHLAIVPDYMYLGQLQTAKSHPADEINKRFQDTKVASRLLQRNVFRSPKMPFGTKLQLFKSLVLSRLTFGAGSWQAMHIHTAKKWFCQMINNYCSVAPNVKRGPGVSNLDIIAHAHMPHPMLVLAQMRFSLFDRIMQRDLAELLAILQDQDDDSSWFQLIVQDLNQLEMQCSSHPVFDVNQQQEPQPLAQYTLEHPRALTKCGKWAVRTYLHYLVLWRDFRQFQQQFEAEATAFGISWHMLTHHPEVPTTFECSKCSASFHTYKALCTHTFKKHADVNIAQRFCSSNTCRACLRVYSGRVQLVHHLKYLRTGCLAKLVTLTEPLDDDQLQEVLAEHRQADRQNTKKGRKQSHRIPVTQAAGPLRPWPWQKQIPVPPPDREHSVPPPDELDSWSQQVMTALDQHQADDVLNVLQQQPYSTALEHHVHRTFQNQPSHDEASKLQPHLALQDAIAMWKGNSEDSLPSSLGRTHEVRLSLQQVRLRVQRPVPADLPLEFRRRLHVSQLWLESSVAWQLQQQIVRERNKQYRFPAPQSVPVSSQPIFLYVFSGRRREGDYEFHMTRFLQQENIECRVLQLDLAISEEHNVRRPALVDKLLGWFSQGYIGGLLVAPPCETWTEARFLPTAEGRDPRPLRSNQFPLALEQLTGRELEQMGVSNFLLYVAVRLLLAAAMTGTPGILEHPKEPRVQDRPTIWRLPWLTALRQQGIMQQILVWQAAFGSPSLKPTHFGVVHLPEFQTALRMYSQSIQWDSLTTLQGRNLDGSWKTSIAKEYPSRLNQALAKAHVLAYLRRSTAQAPTPLSESALRAFEQLYKGDVDFSRQQMAPDFHRHAVILEQLD